jgi:hypothetical protein
MTLSERIQKLKSVFSYEHIVNIGESPLEIRPFRFEPRIGNREITRFRKKIPTTGFCPISDNDIEENKHFTYTVFVPKGTKQYYPVARTERTQLGKISSLGGTTVFANRSGSHFVSDSFSHEPFTQGMVQSAGYFSFR